MLLAVWWFAVFMLAFMLRALYPGLGLLAVGIAFFLQRYVYRYMARYRPLLIKEGDLVEYAEDQQKGYIQKFNRGRVLRKMRSEDVAKSGGFPQEMIPLYSHFYIVSLEEKNVIIPFEWLLSLDFEEELEP